MLLLLFAWVALYIFVFLVVIAIVFAVFMWLKNALIESTPNDYTQAARWVADEDAARGDIVDGEYTDVTNKDDTAN